MTLIIVNIICAVIFGLRASFFISGLLKMRKVKIDSIDFKPITIIVPARNEENNLYTCLESILRLDYPKDLLELIVINDRSEDNTEKIIEEYSSNYQFIKALNITDESQKKNIKGKAGALHQAILLASNELILMTDADCEVHPNWAKSINSIFYNYDADFIPSNTLVESSSFFERLQEIQWIYMHSLASGAAGNNYPMGCYGNNLSISKSKYLELGGYEKVEFSVTEDLALMQAFDKKGFKIIYPCNINTSVVTKPVDSIVEYIKQQHRWTRGGKALGFKAVLFVMSSVSIWFAIAFNLYQVRYDFAFYILVYRLLLDFTLTRLTLTKLGLKRLLFTIIGVPYFMFMELISPFFLLKKKVVWKGQSFK